MCDSILDKCFDIVGAKIKVADAILELCQRFSDFIFEAIALR